MKVVAKPIQCIAWFDGKGKPTPMRFRLINDNITIKVNQVVHREMVGLKN